MPTLPPHSSLFIGLMSGTSLDGIDGVLAAFCPEQPQAPIATLASSYVPFPPALRDDLMALQSASGNEIHREALAANELARYYATCVAQLLDQAKSDARSICAIGVHGQTIRHQPALGYTRQTNNPALLAEITGIDVIADFRSRDIAAGGQGAPLVPAFHQAVFASDHEMRVVANIGGISNISILPGTNQKSVIGFDTGPGNVLLDAWIVRHLNKQYDKDGAWAASGKIIPKLLEVLRSDPYFAVPPPKSTGRDLFHIKWLDAKLEAFPALPPADVQATLTALTAATLADVISAQASDTRAVYVCGGGAYNCHLMQQLQRALADRGSSARVESTEVLGIPPNNVEALAFAWLAHRFVGRKAGNLPLVTGARGYRVLGALYPA